MQNLNIPTIYPSFMNTPHNLQLVNAVKSIPVTLCNVSQVSTAVPTTASFDMNENQPQEIHSLQPMQGQISHTTSLPYPLVMSEYCSFFYAPCNDFQIYHIICEEIPLSFELVSRLINKNNSVCNYAQPNNIYIFYHEQPEIKKIYQITCEMISHTFMFQLLNKIIYDIQFTQREHQQQEFSKEHQENLEFHLKKDLIHILEPYKQNYNLFQDNCTNESMINSVTSNQFQQYNPLPFDQSFTSHQDNNFQLNVPQNGSNQYNQ